MKKKTLKKVSADKLADAMQDMLREGCEVRVLVSGSSMAPFLSGCRDSVTVSLPPEHFRRGDIVFYRRRSGTVIMHRVIGVDSSGRLTLCGDAQVEKEYPVLPEQVFGIVNKAERKGKALTRQSFTWWFFRYPWRWLRFARRFIIKLFTGLKNKKQEDNNDR